MVVLIKGMKMFYIFVILISCTNQILAQSSITSAISQPSISSSTYSARLKELKVGDLVPDLHFENILNYTGKKLKLSDFKGKLIILDLWSTWCSACISAFPKMEKLQSIFKDSIQILLVNPNNSKYDSQERIISTLERNRLRTGYYPTLPIPIHDTIINSYFPHKSVPHQVWISPEGKVIAITNALEVTEQNIRSILKEGNHFSLPVKDDWAFNRSKSLSAKGNKIGILYGSFFTPYNGSIGFSNGIRRNAKNQIIGVYFLNSSLMQFISAAFPELVGEFPISRVILNVNNPLQFSWDYNTKYAYCYDLTIPPTHQDSIDIKQYLRNDLMRFFNIKLTKKLKELNCIVLTSTEKLSNSSTKYSRSQIDLDKSSIKKYIHNCSIDQIIQILDRFESPLINETNLKKNIDIDFPHLFDLEDFDGVMHCLKDAGFHICVERRIVEVIEVSDR